MINHYGPEHQPRSLLDNLRGLPARWLYFCETITLASTIMDQVCGSWLVCRMALYCKCLLRIMFVIANNVYCIPTYVIWMITFFPLKRCSPELYWRIEGLFFHWLLAMVSMWSWSAGYDVVEVGDDIRVCMDQRTLVIANHQSTADVPLLMACFNAKKNILPNITWIMDHVFKYTNFGIVSVLHEDFFIVSGKEKREASLQALIQHLRDSYVPLQRKWMVLFPEGGFLRKRRDVSQRYAVKNNLPVLQHVSLPRVGAMQIIIDAIGPRSLDNQIQEPDVPVDEEETVKALHHFSELKWVLDVTVAYPEGKPLDLPTIVTGSREPCSTFLFYRLYPCTQVPKDHEAMTNWLYDRFIEKERILEAYYSTGQFPYREFGTSQEPPQVVHQDPLRFLILHLFFIASTYVHFQLLSYLMALLW